MFQRHPHSSEDGWRTEGVQPQARGPVHGQGHPQHRGTLRGRQTEVSDDDDDDDDNYEMMILIMMMWFPEWRPDSSRTLTASGGRGGWRRRSWPPGRRLTTSSISGTTQSSARPGSTPSGGFGRYSVKLHYITLTVLLMLTTSPRLLPNTHSVDWWIIAFSLETFYLPFLFIQLHSMSSHLSSSIHLCCNQILCRQKF